MPHVNSLKYNIVTDIEQGTVTPRMGSVQRDPVSDTGEGHSVPSPTHVVDLDFSKFNKKKNVNVHHDGHMVLTTDKDSVASSTTKR
jgi:hypothetical protein